MLISRGAHIFKSVCLLNTKKHLVPNLNQTRNAIIYRGEMVAPSWPVVIQAEIMAGFMYWWILWNLWHSYDVVLKGHMPAPVPEHYTDEELGIPPEDE